jgi:hypothetical protein
MYTLIAFKPEHTVYAGGGDYEELPALCLQETYETHEQIVARIVELRTVRPLREHRYGKATDCVFEEVWVFSSEPETDIMHNAHLAVDEWRRVNTPEAWARDQRLKREMQESNARVYADFQARGLLPRDEVPT